MEKDCHDYDCDADYCERVCDYQDVGNGEVVAIMVIDYSLKLFSSDTMK